jgi:hypothetical protein
MITATNTNPLEIRQYLRSYGLRYTFWNLTEKCDCSTGRAVYLILLSI